MLLKWKPLQVFVTDSCAFLLKPQPSANQQLLDRDSVSHSASVLESLWMEVRHC